MRAVLLATAVLASACLAPAQSAQLLATGAVVFDERVSPLPGTDALTCRGEGDGGTTFVDGTELWNLGKLGLDVVGNRLTAADLDGDGYPDLVVHAVSSNLRQSLDGGRRLVWQLMNRPTPDGTRRMFVDETGNGLFQVRGGSETHYRSAQLAVFGDVDNDGDLDAFSGTYVDPTKPDTDPGDRSELLLNDGTGRFTLAPASELQPGPGRRLPTTSAAFADVDRDGKLDVFVGHWYEAYGSSYAGVQAQLFKGLGRGDFLDVTPPSNLVTTAAGFDDYTNHRPAYGVTACDLDDDGAPELMVSAYGRQPNLLYRNDGTGRFVDQSVASSFDGDAERDFRDNEFFRCWCLGNVAHPSCAGVSSPTLQCPTPPTGYWNAAVDGKPWRNNGNTFTTWCGDVDGDGKPELYNAEIRHWWAGSSSDSSELLRNVSTAGAVKFERPGNVATGLRWPRPSRDWNEGGLMAAGGDLDNDGRLDLVVAASDYADQFGLVFQQQTDGTFVDRATAWGLRHACMSGLVVADFDQDGDLDVIAGASTARDCSRTWDRNAVRLYENQTADTTWLLLRLEGDGVTTNRAAIGAKVTVETPRGTQTREVSGGYGHFGMQNDLAVHVGLGGCEGATRITVRWPDAQGTTQTFERVPANRRLVLKQGEALPFRQR
jgi:hypothetical protein